MVRLASGFGAGFAGAGFDGCACAGDSAGARRSAGSGGLAAGCAGSTGFLEGSADFSAGLSADFSPGFAGVGRAGVGSARFG